ncbi:hypothetical protein MMPV_003921 [Pyropia vietnamensis]
MVAAARRSLVVVGTVALGVLASVASVGAAIKAGKQCYCVMDKATGGECLREMGYQVCRPVTCERSYACVPSAKATHVCLARNVKAVLGCTGAMRNNRCACKAAAPTKPMVSLVPMQRKGRTGATEKCVRGKETHMKVSVEGKAFACVAPMNVGSKTIPAAYSYAKAAQQTWKTRDDALNMVFLTSRARGYAGGQYVCMVMGNKARSTSSLRSKTRRAYSYFWLSKATQFVVADDPTKMDKRDTYQQSKNRMSMLVKQEWHDEKTDGYCFRVTSAMVAKFTHLKYVSGLAVWRGGMKYPSLGQQKFWPVKLSDKVRNKSSKWAYTSGGRVSYPYTPARMSYGRKVPAPPPPSIERVKVTPVCGC